MARRCYPGITGFADDRHGDEVREFSNAVRLPKERARYLRTARKLIDHDTWAYIIQRTDLERLMDSEAKKKLRDQMAYIPERVTRDNELIDEAEIAKGLPEITVENIQATLQGFMADADMIFRRGIANVFSKLDRRFRSHDGFKIGARLILTYVFDAQFGGLRYGEIEDKLIDIERVFAVLDGRPQDSFQSAIAALRYETHRGHGPQQSEVETDYFRIKGYKNGNAHLWFRRDDLVMKVNKILAEWYGEVVADGQTKEADPFEAKTTPAKYFGFYPTPEAATERVYAKLALNRKPGQPELRVLEPSAGTGNLARMAARQLSGWDYDADDKRIEYSYKAIVDCVEIQPHLAMRLEAQGFNRVFCHDFMTLRPETTGLYDRVVANPPFDRERDIDHVMHALEFLKPDGQLVAIMSAGTEFRETRKSIAFRELMGRLNAKWEDLPANSFAEVGTNVNTLIVTVWKDGRVQSRW